MAPRALSARSVIASTLLGTHPPHMPGRLLVAFAERFGVSEGTARVALSRMVERGELENRDGHYHLAGHLIERQRRQDEARTPEAVDWDGSWMQIVLVGPAPAARRAERRVALGAAKLAELREGVWLRPDNLGDRVSRAVATLDEEPVVLRVRPDAPEPLAARLWDLDGWATHARILIAELDGAIPGLDADDDDVLTPGFALAATVLRHLVADPELPPELQPANWPAANLRRVYDDFDAAYRRLLRRFFRAQH